MQLTLLGLESSVQGTIQAQLSSNYFHFSRTGFLQKISLFCCRYPPSQHLMLNPLNTLFSCWGSLSLAEREFTFWSSCIAPRQWVYWNFGLQLFELQLVWSSEDTETGVSSILGRLDAGGLCTGSSEGEGISEILGNNEIHLVWFLVYYFSFKKN